MFPSSLSAPAQWSDITLRVLVALVTVKKQNYKTLFILSDSVDL